MPAVGTQVLLFYAGKVTLVEEIFLA